MQIVAHTLSADGVRNCAEAGIHHLVHARWLSADPRKGLDYDPEVSEADRGGQAVDVTFGLHLLGHEALEAGAPPPSPTGRCRRRRVDGRARGGHPRHARAGGALHHRPRHGDGARPVRRVVRERPGVREVVRLLAVAGAGRVDGPSPPRPCASATRSAPSGRDSWPTSCRWPEIRGGHRRPGRRGGRDPGWPARELQPRALSDRPAAEPRSGPPAEGRARGEGFAATMTGTRPAERQYLEVTMAFRINHIHLKAPDPRKTADWYVQAFNFKILSDETGCSATASFGAERGRRGRGEHLGAGETLGTGDAMPTIEHFGRLRRPRRRHRRLGALGVRCSRGRSRCRTAAHSFADRTTRASS